MHQLVLYYFPSCPYCQYVLEVIEKHQIKVQLNNIHEGETHLKKLVADTGRRTVPCLYIDGVPMHESGDIMMWLESNLGKLKG